MADIDPTDIPLPRVLDPLLDYLSSVLPGPLYSFLETVLAHSLALFTALFSLVYALVTSKPSEWDAQTILPPLITVLGAYLALISLYRTTSWVIRSSVWFAKWTVILGAVFAGAGWVMGNSVAGGGGITSAIGGILLDLINGSGRNAAGGARRQTSYAQRAPRPRAWESFDKHREWQYQETGDDEDNGNGEVQKVIQDILSAAGSALRDGGWWDAMKAMMEPSTNNGDDVDESQPTRRRQPSRRARNTATEAR